MPLESKYSHARHILQIEVFYMVKICVELDKNIFMLKQHGILMCFQIFQMFQVHNG